MTTCNHPGPTCTCRKEGLIDPILEAWIDWSGQSEPGTDYESFRAGWQKKREIARQTLRKVKQERDEARAALTRVCEYHSRMDGHRRPWCEGCGCNWPCATIEAVQGDMDA